MKINEFIEHVVADLGRSGTAIEQKIADWTNRAIKDIYRETSLWLAYKTMERDLEANRRSYAMPELIDDPDLFYYLSTDGTGWDPIQVKGEREAILAYNPGDTGAPKMIVIGKNSFNVYPLPDASYKLRAKLHAYEEPVTYADRASQESDLINEDENVVLTKVLHYGFRYLEEFDKANYYFTGDKRNPGLHDKALRKLIGKNTRMLLGGNFTLSPSQHAKGNASR